MIPPNGMCYSAGPNGARVNMTLVQARIQGRGDGGL